MENMEWKETENATQSVVERMETSMSSMEQMSFDAINITDSLVTLTSKAREYASLMKNGDAREREDSFEEIEKILDKVLETAFQVNNVSHELEQEVIYQRDTTANIRQIIDFLYSMADVEKRAKPAFCPPRIASQFSLDSLYVTSIFLYTNKS